MMSLIKKLFSKNPQPIFTVDWFSYNIQNWQTWLSELKNKPQLTFLEIGSYEGRATHWLLENILTHPTAKIYCIDTFQGSMEHQENNMDMHQVKKNFYHNMKPYQKKISVFEETSHAIIRRTPGLFPDNFFDFIYIDGSHKASDVLEDAVLCFRLLKNNGILIFDDYEWPYYDNPLLKPQLAIDAWLNCFAGQYQLISKNWQVCIKKYAHHSHR